MLCQQDLSFGRGCSGSAVAAPSGIGSGGGRTLRSRLGTGRQVHPSGRGCGLTVGREGRPLGFSSQPSLALRLVERQNQVADTKELELNQRG